MTVRPHFHRVARDEQGNARPVNVTLLRPGTEDWISTPVYPGPTGLAERGSRWYSPDGVVDFYLDEPAIVDVQIAPLDTGVQPTLWADQWVGDAENLTGESLTTLDATAGQFPVADGEGAWAWGGGATAPVTTVNGVSGDATLTATDLGAMSASGFAEQVVLTQAEYDALTPKVGTTLYLIREA